MNSTVTASKFYNFEEGLPLWELFILQNSGQDYFFSEFKSPDFCEMKLQNSGEKACYLLSTLMKTVEQAALAQLGERQTEDLKAPCSIHGGGIIFFSI